MFLAPSCVITAGLHVIRTPNVTTYYMGVPSLPETDNALTAVAAVSPSNVWAAGVHVVSAKPVGNVPEPEILHWDGRSWRIVQLPALPYFDEVRDVAAVAPNNVWAVGTRIEPVSTGSGVAVVPLLLHYDGRRWADVIPPELQNEAGLRGISVLSEKDIWAVGWLFNPATQVTVPLVLHYDGTAWRQVRFPTVPGSSASLNKVAAAGSGAVYAVGGGRSVETSVSRPWRRPPVVAEAGTAAWGAAAVEPASHPTPSCVMSP